MARQANAHATHPTTPLVPLRNSRNQDVAAFPRNLAALNAIGGQLQGLRTIV